MIEHTPEIVHLVKALCQVQTRVHGVGKDSTNPHFKNRYASLEAVIGAVRDPLIEAGITFTQAPGAIIGGAVEITTMLMHTSGQWLRSTLHVPLAKTDPQGVGSAITYGSRYALMAMLGLPPLDDDAEAAVHHKPSYTKPISVKGPIEASEYVTEAKLIMMRLLNESALRTWWTNEKTNREKYKLDQNSGPGLDLMTAYSDRKAELKSQLMMAG